jgi:predicted N-formylglutamate amidohydrolase
MSRSASEAGDGPSKEWPAAATVYNPGGTSPIVLLCEHASNYIPPDYGNLGLDSRQLQAHIAWDIGARDLTLQLSKRLGAVAVLATYSRLLIDLNRPLETPSSIATVSEATHIPGNTSLTAQERVKRSERIFKPFHDQVLRILTERDRCGQPTVIVSVHSFTPVYNGEPRPYDLGVLFEKSADFALSILQALRRHAGVVAEANVPYHIDREEDYSIPVYGTCRGNDAVLIEVNNSRLLNPQDIARWADRLADALNPQRG